MLRINYFFKTVGPFHTGSDINSGTLKQLRRQKCILPEPLIYESTLTEENRRDAVVQICIGVWQSIDWNNMQKSRLMRIWDEFASKLTAAGRCADKYKFLDVLCRSWGIKSCTNQMAFDALDLIGDRELLDIVRNETMYIILKMRAIKDEAKGYQQQECLPQQLFKLRPVEKTDQPIRIVRTEEDIPCISGNSIRGRMRRLAMYDFCRRIGLTKMDRRVYYTFFSGGFLDSSSTYEDFDKLDRVYAMHPMLAVFGCAFGDMMIEGDMKIGWAYPLCRERGTAEQSVWQCLDTVFQTRMDSSKNEDEIDFFEDVDELNGNDKKGGAQQMKYEYEVFAPGTVFEHRLALCSDGELSVSAFWHMLTLFQEQPFLGGMGAVGNGEVEFEGLEIPPGAGAAYIAYLEAHKTAMKEFWEHVKI